LKLFQGNRMQSVIVCGEFNALFVDDVEYLEVYALEYRIASEQCMYFLYERVNISSKQRRKVEGR